MGLRQVTAYHEAGHAVMALTLGWAVHHVVVETFQDGITCSDPPLLPGDWREHCMILLGGLGAEHRLDVPSPSPQAFDERADALNLAAANGAKDSEAFIAALETEVDRSLGKHWSIVREIGIYLDGHDLFPRRMLESLSEELHR